jgi:hypothetical protein
MALIDPELKVFFGPRKMAKPFKYAGEEKYPNRSLEETLHAALQEAAEKEALRRQMPLQKVYKQHPRVVSEVKAVREALIHALCTDVYTLDPDTAADWIAARMRLLEPEDQKIVVTALCRTEMCHRHYPGTAPVQNRRTGEWGVQFDRYDMTTGSSESTMMPVAMFFAEYLRPSIDSLDKQAAFQNSISEYGADFGASLGGGEDVLM